MAKRFTDTDKWKKVWYRQLKPIHKCFWEYLRDNCNNAGIWDVDFELASFQIGSKLNHTEIEKVFKKQFVNINESKWFLVDFIEWQYNCSIEELNPANNAHLSVIRILEKFDIKPIIEGLERAQCAPMYMYKDKDKVKNKEKKQRYGEYNNVLLTDSELQKIKDKFSNWELKIKELDEGIELKGYKYKSHYLAILKWDKNETAKPISDGRGIRRAHAPISEERKKEYEKL